jgi:serine/threonine protein kinase
MNADSDSRCDTRITGLRLSTGESLQHFSLECLIGEGGMGVVYRAFDTKLHRPVAVKVLPPELTSDPERKLRFLQEARLAARINHPSVAQIFYVDEQEGLIFIVMELVEGRTVRQLIQDQRLDLLGVIDIAIQVSDGLAKAHELGIVHRDIKPANVMLTKEGHAKILDFGLAKLVDRKPEEAAEVSKAVQTTMPGMVMGTAAYMSPEQARGVAVDARADLFSVGVLLFEMAVGKSPFHRDSFMDTLHAVAFDQAPTLSSIRPHIPDGLQRIIEYCLQKRPEDRYATARLLCEDLRRLRRETESGQAYRTSWRSRVTEAWTRLRGLPPSQYFWFFAAAGVLAIAFYMSLSQIGTGGLVFLSIFGLLILRHLHNRPQKVQDLFVRRMGKVPEVRLVVVQDQRVTVVVDRPVPQLYSRINGHLRACNRKLYWGQPMSVSILHDISDVQTQQLLTGPGVQYVREDALPAK